MRIARIASIIAATRVHPDPATEEKVLEALKQRITGWRGHLGTILLGKVLVQKRGRGMIYLGLILGWDGEDERFYLLQHDYNPRKPIYGQGPVIDFNSAEDVLEYMQRVRPYNLFLEDAFRVLSAKASPQESPDWRPNETIPEDFYAM